MCCGCSLLPLLLSLKKETADGWGLVLASTEVESLLKSFPLGHIYSFYLITALTLGGAGKTWTMRQRQTQWCRRKGNDLVGKMGLSMVSVGNVARALQSVAGAQWGHQLQTWGSSVCSAEPSQLRRAVQWSGAIASHWRQELTPVLHQSLVTKPLGAKEVSTVEASRAGERGSSASVLLS